MVDALNYQAHDFIVENEWDSVWDRAMDIVFEESELHNSKSLWEKEFNRNLTFDCKNIESNEDEPKPCSYWTEKFGKHCRSHISEDKWAELEHKAQVDATAKESDTVFDKAVKDMVDLELEHAIERHDYTNVITSWKSYQKGTYYHVNERSINKAFATVFKSKYEEIYESAYETAIEKFMLSNDSCSGNDFMCRNVPESSRYRIWDTCIFQQECIHSGSF